VAVCGSVCIRLQVSACVLCCSVLQCVAAFCGVLQCAAVCCSVLQCVAACCSVTATPYNTLQHTAET